VKLTAMLDTVNKQYKVPQTHDTPAMEWIQGSVTHHPFTDTGDLIHWAVPLQAGLNIDTSL